MGTRQFRVSGEIYSKSLKCGLMTVKSRQIENLTMTRVTRQTTLAISFYNLHEALKTNSA